MNDVDLNDPKAIAKATTKALVAILATKVHRLVEHSVPGLGKKIDTINGRVREHESAIATLKTAGQIQTDEHERRIQGVENSVVDIAKGSRLPRVTGIGKDIGFVSIIIVILLKLMEVW